MKKIVRIGSARDSHGSVFCTSLPDADSNPAWI